MKKLICKYNNNYFNDKYQGIPIDGYTKIFDKLLEGIEVILNTDYLDNKEEFDSLAKKIIYTGPIDSFYNYEFGNLDYRSLNFETNIMDIDNYQGNAVVNYTDANTPYTRIIEHKHFENSDSNKTVITKEYSKEYKIGDEPYYPINDLENNEKYQKYYNLSLKEEKVIFGGRLAEYKYYDMDDIIEKVLDLVDKELQ